MSDSELVADMAVDPAPGSAGQAACARKLAADLRGTADDLPTASWGGGRGETISPILDRAAAHFERGELAKGANSAAAVRAALSSKADNERAHARVHEANILHYAGTPFADLAADDAREARQTAARLEWQAARARQLAVTARRLAAAPYYTARTAEPRETAPGTGPLAGVAAAARQLAADVRQSPVRGTYFSDRHSTDLVPADTRFVASTELELAAARFDQGNEAQGRAHLGNARLFLDSRFQAARHGGWERLNDAHPSAEDFQAEAFHHANRAGMIADTLNASGAAPAGGAEPARAARDGAPNAQSAVPDFSWPLGSTVAPHAPGRRATRAWRHAPSASPGQPGQGGSRG